MKQEYEDLIAKEFEDCVRACGQINRLIASARLFPLEWSPPE